MSKINCDVCGTAYPETASQCPICGCVRPAGGSASAGPTESPSREGSYTYVKGGRFSKANVRKRNMGLPPQDMPQFQEPDGEDPQEDRNKTDKGLVVAVCVLLLAIIAVVIYIVTRFFAPVAAEGENGGGIQLQPSTEASTISTTVPVTTEPEIVPTTEETVLPTVEETVEVTEPTTQPTINQNYYVEPFTLNKSDVTIYRNVAFQLKLVDSTGELMEVDWVVEDPEICSVVENTVTGLKVGRTVVQVTINGTTYACIVRVKA